MQQKFNLILYCLLIIFIGACKKNETNVKYEVLTINENINIHKTIFINDSIGFACGGTMHQYGAIFKTNNKGVSWKKVYSSNLWSIFDLHFINDSIGFACGDTLLLLTTNNRGESWQHYWFNQMPFHIIQRTAFKKFNFLNEHEFYIVGGQNFDAGIVYKTTDAGNTWKFDIFKNEIKGISFPDSTNGFVSGYGVIYKSIDAGSTYQLLSIKEDFFTSIHFFDKNNGIAVGYNGGIYQTKDAGSNWSIKINPNKAFEKRIHFNDLQFEDNNKGYAVGTNGLLVYTEDGGTNWKFTKKFCKEDFFSITIIKKNQILLSSENGKIYKVFF